ncbi:MAG: hypothetical protein RLZ10_2152, partial [Bacteroidota bacterium]
MKKLMLSFFVLFTWAIVSAQTISIIGTFNGWAGDVNMTSTDNVNWTLDYTFSANEQLKFRQDAAWTINWGGTTFPTGTGIQDGADISVPAGTYSIAFNSSTGAYNFQSNNPNPPSDVNPTNRQIVLQGFWW